MASKSKKRRRVLGASCILAALIIAGSSFAWFTSKDEVTNRLTANADYGVSIVESFVPPKNWLPGQEINKDVYAVNTGNVDAYVKEKITGILNYTYEQVIDTLAPDCVQLTPDRIAAIDGATTEEAGGYLAWTDAMVTTTTYTVDGAKVALEDYDDGDYKYKVGEYYAKELNEGDNTLYTRSGEPGSYTYTDSGVVLNKATATNKYPTGSVNSARENTVPNTDTGVANPRWTPPATGAYIFRRAIDTTSTGNSFDNPSFTYAGYYFVKAGDKLDGETQESAEDRYYEIVIGNDAHPTDDTETYPAATNPGYAAWNFDVNVTSGNLGNDVTTGDPITVNSLGDINGTPKIRYVKEYTVDNQAAEFAYDPGDHSTNKPATLTVQYAPATIVASSENVAAAQAALTTAQGNLTTAENALTAALDGKTDDQRSEAAATAERNYENALGAYNTALSRYKQTLADFNLAKDVATATNALYDAADARAVFQAKLDAAEKAKNDAWNDAEGANPATDESVVGKAAAMVDDDSTNGAYYAVIDMANGDASAVSFKSLFGNADKDYEDVTTPTPTSTLVGRINHLATTYANSTDPNASRFTNLKENMDRMHSLWAEIDTLMEGSAGHGNEGDLDYVAPVIGIKADLTTLATDTSDGMDPVDLNKIETRLDANIAALKTKMKAYNEAWTEFKRAAAADVTSQALTEIADNGTSLATVKDQTDSFYDAYFTANTGLKALIEDYKTKYNTWHDMNDDSNPPKPNSLGQAKADWTAAVNKYNGDIDTAKSNYDTAIDEIQPELNNYYRLSDDPEKSRKLTDQSSFVLNETNDPYKYKAENTGTNGKFASEPDYTSLTGTVTVSGSGSTATYTPGSMTDKTIPTDTTFNQVDTSDASGKKEDVNEAGGTFHVFTLKELETAKDNAFGAVYGNGGTVETPKANSPAKLYEDAKQAIKDVANARTAVTNATQAVNTAQAAYDAATGAASPVKIIIQLADDADDLMWQYDATNTGAPAGTEADFYYKKVLEAGKTSDKLIDSVRLDESVRAQAYKTLVFDLNVGLDSIQVTYDADQRNYSTEAVNAEDTNFKLDVTNTDPITKDTVLTWG